MKTIFRILIIMALLYGGLRLYARMTEKSIDEALPTDAGTALRTGVFVSKDGSHESRGKVTLYDNGESKLLRFEEFYVTNGFGLRVYFVTGGVVASSTVSIARLKGNSGNQNYEIPKEMDVANLDTVLVYSKVLQTLFSAAILR